MAAVSTCVDGEVRETNPYAGLTAEHEALIRRLHREAIHPDYD